MGVQDDFRLWERELDEPAEPSGDRAPVVVSAALLTGSVLLIVFGQALLGTAILVVSTIIVVLWRAGM
ncbi:MAG: hypothetical protein ACRDOO_19960 [Actinomadura sp.]